MSWFGGGVARQILSELRYLSQRMDEMASSIDDLTAAVARQETVEASATTFIAGLIQQLKDAVASGNPQAIASLIARLDAASQPLALAIAANTTGTGDTGATGP